MHRRMSKSLSFFTPVVLATLLGGISCSDDSEPQGEAEGGASAYAGSGTGGSGTRNTGGSSGMGAAGGTTAAAGATNSASAGTSYATLTSAVGASGQSAQSTSGGAGGSVIPNGGTPSTGESSSSAGAGGSAANSAGAAGIAGTSVGTAGAAGALTVQDPRCAVADAGQTLTANLKITADNECDVYVNGQAVGQTSSWSSAVTIDVSLYVHPGRKNVVAVVGRNTSSQGGNDRGIIGQLTTTVGTSVTPILVTNSEWVVSQSPGAEWTLLDYDASDWIPATEVAAAGDPPWGNVMGTGSEAKWIWFAPVPNSTSEKPNLEATYSRRVFYFDFEGRVVSSPSCESPAP